MIAPPAAPIDWRAWKLSAPSRKITITARLWFEARNEAMRLLRCGQGEVSVVPKKGRR